MTDNPSTTPATRGILDLLTDEVRNLAAPVLLASASEGEMAAFLEELGFVPAFLPLDLAALGSAAEAITTAVDDIGRDGEPQDLAAVASSLAQLGRLIEQFRALIAGLEPATLPDELAQAIPHIVEDVASYLVASWIAVAHPRAARVLRGLGVLATKPSQVPQVILTEDGHPAYMPAPIPYLELGTLISWIRDPRATLNTQLFGTPTAPTGAAAIDAIATGLLPRLRDIARDARYPFILGDELDLGPLSEDYARVARATLAVPVGSRDASATLALVLEPGEGGGPSAALLAIDGTVSTNFSLGSWSGTVTFSGQPGLVRIDSAGHVTTDTGSFDASATVAPSELSHPLRIGGSTGTSVEISTVNANAMARFSPGHPAAIKVEVDLNGVRLRIAAGDADSFLQQVVGQLLEEVSGLSLDLTLGWAWGHGVYLRTAAGDAAGRGLVVDRAVDLQVGPLHVSTIHAAVRPEPIDGVETLTVEVGVTAIAALGPFTVTASRFGIAASVAASGHGNLGPVDADLSFDPPSSLGIAIASPAVSGGGFLSFDDRSGTYAGAVELTLVGTVAVSGIGVVTTRMPDGQPGFALLILITAEGFTPVQLGLGFTMTGIGGLIALNRTVDADAVRGGLKDGILDSVLFVKDPVKNADRVLTTLDKVFPVARDRLVVGPLAEISWGTPAIVHLRLALLLDLPMPIRAVVLAALSMTLPEPKAPIVEIHVDAVGELDLSKGRLSLDASLHHSRILTFTLTGDMALRLDWGDQPGFLLSVGGFHPRFTPPPGLRPLKRLSLQLTSSDKPLVRFEAYLAVTSNTLQMGARASVALEVGGFGIEGGGSFDTLIQWAPFHLEADVAAWVRVLAGGQTILSLNLALSVSGPAPWHLTGTAEFHILFISVSVHVDLTLGASASATSPVDVVDVPAIIWERVAAIGSWQAVLPSDTAPGAILQLGPVEDERVVAHPMATVSVRQKVIPLGVPVSHVGAHVPRGGTATHQLTVTTPQGTVAAPLSDLFAPAQFTDVPAEQKLSAPSFRSYTSGFQLAPGAVADTSAPSTSCPAVVDTLDLTGFDAPPVSGGPAAAVAGTGRRAA
jgi:hypothetical protein